MAEQEKVSEKDTGQTEEAQVSKETGQTDPNPDEGDREVDLTKELTTKFVLNPKRPDMTMTGEQIRNAIGLGKLASERESELHKTQNELEQAKQENADAKRELELLRINSKIFDLESRSPKETEEDVFKFEEEDAPEVDQQKVIRQQIDPILKKTESEMAELRKKIQSFEQTQTERERKEAFQKFGQTTQKDLRQDNLRKQLNVLSTAEIDEIIANENSARNLGLQADDLAKQGKDDEAMDLAVEADGYRDVAVTLRAQGLVKQQRAKAKEDAKEALLQETRSSIDESKVTEDLGPQLNPDKAKEVHAKRMARAREKDKARKLLRLNQE